MYLLRAILNASTYSGFGFSCLPQLSQTLTNTFQNDQTFDNRAEIMVLAQLPSWISPCKGGLPIGIDNLFVQI